MITEVPFLNARIIGQKYLNVSDIKIGWMPRGIDWDYVEQLAEVLRNDQKFPEDVQVFEDNELTDGLHRTEGYKKVETITIPVLIWKCPKENRTALKIYLNSLHGKQLSPKEKQESYMSLLEENPSIKDTAAALILGVSERTIQRWKPETLKQKRLSQEEVQKIQELKEEGKTNTEIAKELEVDESAIRQHLRRNDKCQISDSPSPTYLEPDDDKALPISEVLGSNVIKAPVEFRKPPVQKEVHVDPDYPDDDDEDEEDLDIETPDDEKKMYRVVKEPSLRDEWKTVMESILRISERADKLRSHLHEVVLAGEFELVLCGSLQKAQSFLSYLREFVPEDTDTTIPNERR